MIKFGFFFLRNFKNSCTSLKFQSGFNLGLCFHILNSIQQIQKPVRFFCTHLVGKYLSSIYGIPPLASPHHSRLSSSSADVPWGIPVLLVGQKTKMTGRTLLLALCSVVSYRCTSCYWDKLKLLCCIMEVIVLPVVDEISWNCCVGTSVLVLWASQSLFIIEKSLNVFVFVTLKQTYLLQLVLKFPTRLKL